MSYTTNTRGVSEAMRDAVAKAVADVIGHGMREKCYAHADAAIAALSAEPAAQGECVAEVVTHGSLQYGKLNRDGISDGTKLYTAPPAQPAELPEFLKDPANVHAMMLRGAIAIPSIRSMVDLRGEVPNGEDVQLARIAELQEQVATLEAKPAERDEMSPDFTDSARAAITWVLYHHQGGSSPIGQPLRFALGMSGHERLQDWRIAEAKRWAEHYGATTEQFHRQPAERVPEGFIVVPLLNPEEMQALRRFAETAEDDESYDVPKEMMGVLSLHGAVTRGSRLGWYWLTDFGRMLLAAAQQADR